MKRFLTILMMWCSFQGYAQSSLIYYDDRDSNGTGLVLYSNGLFECDYQYYFLKDSNRPPLFLSKGTWHPIDSNLIELKSFDEYKARIVNVLAYRNAEILDSVKIRVYNKEGMLVGFANLDAEYKGVSYQCSVGSLFAKDDFSQDYPSLFARNDVSQEYYKKKTVINLPYELTYDLNIDYNQYYFIVSSYSPKGHFSYHNCIIEINPKERHFRVVENREYIYYFNP